MRIAGAAGFCKHQTTRATTRAVYLCRVICIVAEHVLRQDDRHDLATRSPSRTHTSLPDEVRRRLNTSGHAADSHSRFDVDSLFRTHETHHDLHEACVPRLG